MREITGHVVNPVNDKIKIFVLDKPGHGGASHVYAIDGMALDRNDAAAATEEPKNLSENFATIIFQCGPINEHGVNGVTQEALLAIIADRLQCFQAGPYASDLNAVALKHIEAAQEALLSRTRERMARGVEGTHEK